jgi:hypothetical protein
MQVLNPLLINILGHAAGALIFAIFLVLLYSERGWSGVHGRNLSGLAAGLSLIWNLGSLVVLAWPGLPPLAADIVAAISFSVLSLLPAVLLDISLGANRRALVTAGYALSSVAVILHFLEIAGHRAALHQTALLIITVGFLLLAGAAVIRSADGTRILAAMCLALFAMSFIHFGTGHAGQAWSSELVIHHAGIPLALFVLLQDYRFVLLDAFVRFLANALLAAVLTGLVIAAAFRLVLVRSVVLDPLHEAMLLISVCLFLVCFAWLRNRVERWLTRALFRQGTVADLAAHIRNCPEFSHEDRYLNWAAAAMAAAVQTKGCKVVGLDEMAGSESLHTPVTVNALPGGGAPRAWNWAEAVVPVRLSSATSKLILLGRRQGGRRYLSEDLDALARAAAEIAAHVEALRRRELNRLVSQAELRALEAQMNPHFLFNALNTVYGTIPREAAQARRVVLKLADIFRYFTRSEKPFVPLSHEMEIVRAYLEVEQIRLGERLAVTIDVDPAALEVPIPVLSIEPLVENAIKHGIAMRETPGSVRVQAKLANARLLVTVENSRGAVRETSGTGLGLRNVERRLEICYGPAAGLRLDFGPEYTTAELSIPLQSASGLGAG